MRIIYYYRGVPADTALVNMTEMIAALREVGHEVISCFPMQGGSTLTRGAPSRLLRWRTRVPRLVWNLGQLWADRRGARRLLSLCESLRPDLIHDRYLPLSLATSTVARRLGIPLVTIVHELPAHQMPEKFSPILRGLARAWERRSLRAADRVLTVSTQLRDWLVDHFLLEDSVCVMPNGVRAAAYENLAAARESRRLELGFAGDELALGYLQRWERIAVHRSAEDVLCQLMGRLPSPRVRLVLIGGGSELGNVKRRMAEDARVADRANFVGQVPHDEVPSYLAALDIALLPAHESFTSPLKLFEYMAAAKPVVAPALPNIAEIVRDGETGLLFPPGNVEAMASQVLRLIDAPEQRQILGEAARSEVLAKYTWEANARRLTQIAQEVQDARRR